MPNTDEDASRLLADGLREMAGVYRERGLFRQRFGFGRRAAVVVVDFAYGWTNDAYAGGSRRLDGPVENTRVLLEAVRPRKIPIVYTTAPWRPQTGDPPFKTAADDSPGFRPWDRRAVQIDDRLAPQSGDLIMDKENASAFFGTHLAPYLIAEGVDTLLITGCSTSACIRATATDAKSFRFRPIVIRECVGDRSAVAHVFTLADLEARFADVVSLEEALGYLQGLP
jgi:nicotinamidase-related amidase